jgi:hypothetical protein
MNVSDKLEKEFFLFQTVPENSKSEHYKNVLPYFPWLSAIIIERIYII